MASFSPVTSNKLYIQIYNQIREAIASGMFKVGDKLPSEKELCQMFNVSRVPVREALCALELNGLVESNQGAGVYVRDTDFLPNSWAQEIEPQDIIRTRMILEPEVARAAAANAGAADKARLKEIVEVFRTEAEAETYSNDTDRAFHMCVARSSGNQMFVAVYDMIWKAMEQKMWELLLQRTVTSEKYRRKNYEEHLQIAQAIQTGDAEAAWTIMKTHMENLELRAWG